MASGLILLGFLAVLFAYAVGKARRKMGLPVKLKTIVITMTGFVIVVLLMWVGSGGRG